MARGGKIKNTFSQGNKYFAQARANIARSGNIRRGLGAYKFQASVSELEITLPEFLKHHIYTRLIWPCPKPKTYDELGRSGLPFIGDFTKELAWATISLSFYGDTITQFMSAKAKFENLLLTGQYEYAEESLKKIEKDHGVSIWLIESKINLYQEKYGIKIRTKYVEEVISHKTMYPLVKYLISWISFKSEQTVAYTEFYKLLNDMVPLGDGFTYLVHMYFDSSVEISEDIASRMLAYTDILPVIDRYMFTVKILQAFICHMGTLQIDQNIIRLIHKLYNATKDRHLGRCLRLIGVKVSESKSIYSLCEAIDSYTTGKYHDALAAAELSITAHPSIEALIIIIRSKHHLGEHISFDDKFGNSHYAIIMTELDNIFKYKKTASESVLRLKKITLMHISTSWSSSLYGHIIRQEHDDRYLKATFSQVLYAVRADMDTPILYYALPSLSEHVNSFSQLPLHSDANSSHLLASAVIEDNDQIFEALSCRVPSYRLKMHNAYRHMRHGRPSEAVEILAPLFKESKQSSVNIEVGVALSQALYAADMFHRCADICARLFLTSSYLADVIPIEALVARFTEMQEKLDDPNPELYGHIAVVVCFDIYSKKYSSSKDSERSDALKDFLAVQKVDRPSEIINMIDDDKELANYFLQVVCVPSVIDQLLTLSSSRAVEEERVRILVLLSEQTAMIDKGARIDALEELREIKTRQVVKETKLQLDQSKIYVNVDGIRNSISAPMRESWQRYKIISLQQSDSSDFDDLRRILEEKIGEKLALFSLSLPLTERNKLFARMVRQIRELFSVSREFGLDANLSSNIRHGFVMREIRGPFLSRNLITNKISDADDYNLNTYWMDKLQKISPQARENISNALNQLSEKIDAEIETLTRKIMRIKSDTAPEGLFDFTLSDLEIQLFQRSCANVEDSEEFLNRIFDLLWDKTKFCLQQIRSLLLTNTQDNLFTAINDLQIVLHSNNSDPAVSQMLSGTNLVRPEITSAIERVANWFTLAHNNDDFVDYEFNLAYEAALETLKTYNSHLTIDVSFEAKSDLIMYGYTLPYMVRLFLLLLENCTLHSGIRSGRLPVSVTATLEGGLLTISVANELGANKSIEELSTTVQRLNQEYGREAASQFVEREGGSGYPKLWKLLTHDLRCEHVVNVEISDTTMFRTEVVMESRRIVV